MPLTEIAIRRATADTKPKKLADAQGLYLLVQPTGSKLWRFKYRIGGKEKLLALGVYPEVGLKDARTKRDEARKQLGEGLDPSLEKKIAKTRLSASQDDTFEQIARKWWSTWSTARTAKHARQVMRRLEVDVFPDIGRLPIESIKPPLLLALAKKIEDRGARELAHRAFQVTGQVFRYAIGHGLVEHNPAASVRPSDVLKPRSARNLPRLDPTEVPALLRKIDAYDGYESTRLAIQLMALTFVRTSELIYARWDEFDIEAAQWRIPPDRMKMKTPHIVPLSRQSLAILKRLRELAGNNPLLFPGERDHEKPMSNNTILYALYRMGYHSRMTGHGFRGVASTILHELGFNHEFIEIQLAHQERNKVSAAYNHAKYVAQRTEMMQAWADHLDTIKRDKRVLNSGVQRSALPPIQRRPITATES